MLITRFDYIEFYVANLPVVQFLFKHGLGFENCSRIDSIENINYNTSLIFQNDINIVLSSSCDSLSELSKEISLSGDFIKDVAFEVADIEQVISNASAFGTKIIEPIHEFSYSQGIIKKATIASFGNTRHSLIQKTPFVKDALHLQKQCNNGPLEKIDHIAVAVEYKNLDKWVDFYKNIFGLQKIFEESVVTEHSGMMSVVVGSDQKGIKIVLVSPVDGKSRSQISDFISNNNGEGVQHIAFSTSNIIKSIKDIKNKGVEFLDVNDDYYNKLDLPESYLNSYRDELKNLRILYDKDEYGELLQIFSKKLHSKPTWFLEILERKGAKTFGRGNVKKLYESVEKELSKQYAK